MSYVYTIAILSTTCSGRQTCQSTQGLSLTQSALGTVYLELDVNYLYFISWLNVNMMTQNACIDALLKNEIV